MDLIGCISFAGMVSEFDCLPITRSVLLAKSNGA